MKLYVIRHGESESNAGNFYGSWLPVELTPKGRQQAAQAGLLLQNISFDAAYCSDLLRAQQTAAIALPQLKFTYTDVLREIKVGNLLGRDKAECARELGEPYLEHCRQTNYRPYQGENRQDVTMRAKAFLDQMVREQPGQKIAVVCHAGMVRAMLRYVLGADFPTDAARVDNASVSVFSYEKGKWSLDCWNQTNQI